MAPYANWEAIAFVLLWAALVTAVGLTMDQIYSKDEKDPLTNKKK
jgi:hypothetical protein